MFCDADVTALAAVDMTRSDNPRFPQARLAVQLMANNPGTLSGDVLLLTDDAAYDAHFAGLVAQKKSPSDQFATAKVFLIGFSKPLAVRYAWVDEVGMNGAAPKSCPSNPFGSASGNGSIEPVQLPTNPIALQAFTVVPATLRMTLPPVTCSEPYREPNLLKWGDEKTDVFDSTAGLKASTRVQVFLDSNGKVAYASVARSSGAVGVDNAAVSKAAQATYQPAIFRCTPVVSSMYVDVNYEIVH